jgi:hypothetical protein
LRLFPEKVLQISGINGQPVDIFAFFFRGPQFTQAGVGCGGYECRSDNPAREGADAVWLLSFLKRFPSNLSSLPGCCAYKLIIAR